MPIQIIGERVMPNLSTLPRRQLDPRGGCPVSTEGSYAVLASWKQSSRIPTFKWIGEAQPGVQDGGKRSCTAPSSVVPTGPTGQSVGN